MFILKLFWLYRFKNNGKNFQIQLSGNFRRSPGASIAENINVTLPEDLVEIQAYIRWEKKGRQKYTPEQEKASLLYFVVKVCVDVE